MKASCDICAERCKYTPATQTITRGGERISVCSEHAKTQYDAPPPPPPTAVETAERFEDFGGRTYDPDRDRDRLGAQLLRVLDLMEDGQWRTLKQISEITEDPEASISARLRDFRKMFGTDAMEARRGQHGLWAYRYKARL